MTTLKAETLQTKVDQLRLKLIAKAKEGGTAICYKELWPARRWVGQVVGAISNMEYGAGRHLLSALVVRKDTGMPGNGFWGLDGIPPCLRRQSWEDQSKPVPQHVKERRRKWWEAEKAAVHQEWQGSDL